MMPSRSTLLHVRLPFSWYLLPVYMMALAFAPVIDLKNAVIIFIVMHIFLYTASNGFNSYYDRDTESIGGLRNPPPVTNDLLWFSLALDAIGLIVALFVGWQFALGCFIYGIASKMYSFDRIRIKKYGGISWLFVGLGQGVGVFLLIAISISGSTGKECSIVSGNIVPAILTGFFLLGIFPLTQIYQHREDARRNDLTLSRMLGIEKTFLCAVSCVFVAIVGFSVLIYHRFGIFFASLFLGLLAPAVYYFGRWFYACRKDPAHADFDHCMRMNLLASTGVNIFGAVAAFLIQKG
jgi:4-hydroxybenzoate polyprenyltransferase